MMSSPKAFTEFCSLALGPWGHRNEPVPIGGNTCFSFDNFTFFNLLIFLKNILKDYIKNMNKMIVSTFVLLFFTCRLYASLWSFFLGKKYPQIFTFKKIGS